MWAMGCGLWLGRRRAGELCINYANESLQQLFNERVLLNEKALYAAQGIKGIDLELKARCAAFRGACVTCMCVMVCVYVCVCVCVCVFGAHGVL